MTSFRSLPLELIRSVSARRAPTWTKEINKGLCRGDEPKVVNDGGVCLSINLIPIKVYTCWAILRKIRIFFRFFSKIGTQNDSREPHVRKNC